jgi:hypothetical protein
METRLVYTDRLKSYVEGIEAVRNFFGMLTTRFANFDLHPAMKIAMKMHRYVDYHPILDAADKLNASKPTLKWLHWTRDRNLRSNPSRCKNGY